LMPRILLPPAAEPGDKMNFPAPPSHDNNGNINNNHHVNVNLNAAPSSRQQSLAHAQQLHQAQQQAQQQQQALAYQQQLLMNGLNGAGQVPAAMPNFPTPAGHSAELNYIHAMVEELSRQLADNKRALEEVVTGVGRVRNRARAHQMGNEELIAGGSPDELGGTYEKLLLLLSLPFHSPFLPRTLTPPLTKLRRDRPFLSQADF